jgi:ABC-type bacteriocin/lantibiotic exporter with double-glycine peptidase domain
MAAAYKIIPGIVKVINVSGQIRTYKFSISELVQNAKEGAEETNTSPACIHSIGLKGVSFKYADLTVLSNFHLCINKGDFVGISGKSGRGKTTVFNLLLGFLSPAKGEIFINDCAVSKEEIKKFWHSISYVRQQSFFIHDTILRNITLEEEGYNKNNLDLALAISGLNELISTFSEGLQKVITENGKNISGGQQQRIALARAVYKNADLILLDEPFNELDEASEILMLEYFQQLAQQDKIVVIITHDKQSLSYCNKIISLDEQ